MSMYSTKRESLLHKRIVAGLIDYYTKKGWTIEAAAYEGYDEPYKVGRHEPDVIARKDGVLSFGEAKSGEGDINTEHSREQYIDFSNREMSDSKLPCPFYATVPENSYEEIKNVFIELGIYSKPSVTILTYKV